MRIARGNQIIGEWSISQIKIRLANAVLLLSDFYYDEDASEWLTLGDLTTRQPPPKPVKTIGRPCYCGSGLSFNACHGDGSQY
jgi:hypothetical protein